MLFYRRLVAGNDEALNPLAYVGAAPDHRTLTLDATVIQYNTECAAYAR